MVVFKSLAIAGKPGRYISMDNGPIADSNPRISISNDRLVLFMVKIRIVNGNWGSKDEIIIRIT